MLGLYTEHLTSHLRTKSDVSQKCNDSHLTEIKNIKKSKLHTRIKKYTNILTQLDYQLFVLNQNSHTLKYKAELFIILYLFCGYLFGMTRFSSYARIILKYEI